MRVRLIGWIPLLIGVVAAQTAAQTLMRPLNIDGEVHILSTDLAILGSVESRTDLPCRVSSAPARLGFDLQYRAGYVVRVPLAALAGGGNALRILFRIMPLDGDSSYYYFVDRYDVPAIGFDAEGEATLTGQYHLGPGRYSVDWMMRDQGGQVCSDHWEVKTSAVDEFADLAATQRPFAVSPANGEVFEEDPPVPRAATQSLLHVKILVNFTPTDPRDVRLRRHDLHNLVSILRAISREPQVGTFSLVAFNMQEERVIFEQTAVPKIDFPGLGEAVESIRGGTIDFAQLGDEKSATTFLTELLRTHLGAQDPEPDAIMILGPKLMLEKRISTKLLAEAGAVSSPVFYLIYNMTPRAYPWKDAISSVLKVYKGLQYTITLPKDLGRAMNDMVRKLTSRSKEKSSDPSEKKMTVNWGEQSETEFPE